MTKQELMENYTVKQLADIVVSLEEQSEVLQGIIAEKERKLKSNIIPVVIDGIVKEYQIEEIGDIVRAYEEIKICQEQNKKCKTILPSEYLKVLTLNQKISELQSEVEKYRKAFEDAKKKYELQVLECQKENDKLAYQLKDQKAATIFAEEYTYDLKKDLDYAQAIITQMREILNGENSVRTRKTPERNCRVWCRGCKNFIEVVLDDKYQTYCKLNYKCEFRKEENS